MQYRPTVSICTVTHNRQHFLPRLEQCIRTQTYPSELIQWVLLDDSSNNIDFTPSLAGLGLGVKYQRLSEKLPIGRKRNLSHQLCLGDIIVYMDDDDFYHPTWLRRVITVLLDNPGKELVGCVEMPHIYIHSKFENWKLILNNPNAYKMQENMKKLVDNL